MATTFSSAALGGRQVLSKFGRGTHAAWVGDYDVTSTRNDYVAASPYVREHQSFTPNNGQQNVTIGVTPNPVTTFEVDRRGDLWKGGYLSFTRSALPTAADADQRYFVDWEGGHRIREITVRYNNKVVWSKQGYQLVEEAKDHFSAEKRQALAAQMAGDRSQADRLVIARNATNFLVDLRLPNHKLHKAWALVGLANRIILEIHWENEAQVQVQDLNGAQPLDTTTVLSNIALSGEFIQLPEMHRTQVYNLTQTRMGIKYKITSYNYEFGGQVQGWAPGANANPTLNAPAVIQMRNIRNSVYLLKSYARYTSDINANGTNPRLRLDNFIPHSAFISDAGSRISDLILGTDNGAIGTQVAGINGFQRYNEYHDMYKQGAEHGVLNYPVVLFPQLVLQSDDDSLGSLPFSKFTNLEYNLAFADAVQPGPDGAQQALDIRLEASVMNLIFFIQGTMQHYVI